VLSKAIAYPEAAREELGDNKSKMKSKSKSKSKNLDYEYGCEKDLDKPKLSPRAPRGEGRTGEDGKVLSRAVLARGD